MNISNSQNQTSKCCVDYCTTTFSGTEQSIVNAYKCEGKKLSSSDIWNIQKQRKEVSLRNYSL